ncbi:phospholipase-like protein [Tanacetum coccineum]
MNDYVACKERSEHVDDQNGFTRNDEPEAEQDGSGALDRESAGAKVEETKSTREVALEEELDLWKSRYVELESYYKNLEASVEIARKNSLGLSFLTPNSKAMSVCDDTDEANAATDDNAKATSVYDDVVIPDAAADDNVKATSVHDYVGVPDAATDDNEKATSVYDDIDQADADAHKIINHTDPPIHGFQIMLWGGLEKKGDGLDETKANQIDTKPEEVVLAADNGEVVKETQLPNSHKDVFQPRASKRMKKETLQKHADLAIFSPYYYNLLTPNDLEDWILKEITYPVGWADIEMVYILVNISGIHWFLAVFKIRKGVITFYDTLSDKKPWDKEDRPW